LCLLVGAADGTLSATSVNTWYLSLVRPSFTPPNWMFGPVWTLLHVLMGLAAWLVWQRPGHRRALRTWGWQLALNAAWAPAFFGLRQTALGLVVILALLGAICITIAAFVRIRPAAALLLVPYLAWTCYAAFLNAAFWWLNPA
jgi:tryptophan-rich sensory protein